MAQDQRFQPGFNQQLHERLVEQAQAHKRRQAQNDSYLGDTATDLGSALLRLPSAVTGLADIPTAAVANRPFDRLTDWVGETTGFQPSRWAEELEQKRSPEGRSALQAFHEAQGARETTAALLRNPRALSSVITQSVPPMLAGGAIGRGLRLAGSGAVAKGTAGPVSRALSRPAVAAGAGEGAISAGFTMSEIDEDVDPRKAALASLGSGAGVSLFAGLGAGLSRRLNFGDPELLVVGGRTTLAPGVRRPNLAKRIFGGAVSEGVFQELPQSAVEQVGQNWAEDRPLLEGVDKAAVSGMIAGMGLGALAGPFGPREYQEPPATDGGAGGDTTTTPPRQPPGIDESTLSNRDLVAGVNTLSDMLAGAEGEKAELVRDALLRGQAELKRRNVPPAFIREQTAVAEYGKLLSQIQKRTAKIEDVQVSNLPLADQYRRLNEEARAQVQQLAEIYPDLPKQYRNQQYADLQEELETARKKAKKGKARQRKAARDKLEVLQQRAVQMEELYPDLPQQYRDQQYVALREEMERAKIREARDEFEELQQRVVEMEEASPGIAERTQQSAVGEVAPTPDQPATGTQVAVPATQPIENAVKAAAQEASNKAEARALTKADGTLNKAGTTFVESVSALPVVAQEQMRTRLNELVEGGNNKPKVVAQKRALDKMLAVPEVAQELATVQQQQADRAGQPLDPVEMAEAISLAQSMPEKSERLTNQQQRILELWAEAKEADRKSAINHIQTGLFLEGYQPVKPSTVRYRLNAAKRKLQNAVAIQRGISQEQAKEMFSWLRLGPNESVGTNSQARSGGEVARQLADAIDRGDTQEEAILRAQLADRDPELAHEQDDSGTGFGDRANQGALLLESGEVLDPEAGFSARDRPEDSPQDVVGKSKITASELDSAGQQDSNLAAKLAKAWGVTNVTKPEAKRFASLRRSMNVVENELSAANSTYASLERQFEQAQEFFADEEVMETLAYWWDRAAAESSDTAETTFGFIAEDPYVVTNFMGVLQTYADDLVSESNPVTGVPEVINGEIFDKLVAFRESLLDAHNQRQPFMERMMAAQDRITQLEERLEASREQMRLMVEHLRDRSDGNITDQMNRIDARIEAMPPLPRESGTLGAVISPEVAAGLQKHLNYKRRERILRGAVLGQDEVAPRLNILPGLTYSDLRPDTPESAEGEAPALPTVEEAKQGKYNGVILEALRRENRFNEWFQRKRDSGRSAVGEDGVIYTTKRRKDGMWELYAPAALSGKVSTATTAHFDSKGHLVDSVPAKEEEFVGVFKSFDGEGDSVTNFVGAQTKYTVQELFRQQAAQHKEYAKKPIRSEVQVRRRKAKAKYEATKFRAREGDAVNPPPSTSTRAVKKHSRRLAELPGMIQVGGKDSHTWVSADYGKTRMSVAWQRVDNPATVESATEALNEYIPQGRRKNVRIVQSMLEVQDYILQHNLQIEATAGAFIHNGNVFVIADNVEAGRESGVLMHEVGVHMAMSPRQIGLFAQAIRNMDNQYARDAMTALEGVRNLMEGRGGVLSQYDLDHELVAYFVEQAVNGGVDPTNLGSDAGVIGRFFNNLLTYIRTALRAMGLSTEALTPQDIVDAAYGAADTVFRRPTNDTTVRYSIDAMRSSAGRLGNVMVEQSREQGASLLADAKYYTQKLGQMMMFGHDFAAWVGDMMPSAREYFIKVSERVQQRGDYDARLQHVIDPAVKMSRKDRDAVNDLLLDSTSREAWAFQPDWSNAVLPTMIDPELSARYEAMSEEQQSLIYNVFKTASQMQYELAQSMRNEIIRTANQRVERAAADPDAVEKLLEELSEDLAAYDRTMGRGKAAWLPLRRFGNFAVVYISDDLRRAMDENDVNRVRELKQDGNHYIVEFTKSRREAEARSNDIRSRRSGGAVEFFEREKSLTRSELIPFNMVHALQAQVEAYEGLDAFGQAQNVTGSAVMNAINKLYITQLSETSIRKSELERLNVSGADRDMLRAFVEFGTGVGGTIAAINLNRETHTLLHQIRDEVRNSTAGTRAQRQQAFNELLERHAFNVDQRPEAGQQAVMGVTSFWMLLTSPAYYLQNSTQPWMLTLPVLAGKFGFVKSSNAMLRNYKVMRAAFAAEHTQGKPLFGGELASVEVIAEQKGERYKQLIDTLVDRGLFDIGIAADLGNFGAGLIQRVHGKFTHAVRSVEVFNRGVTALSAMELALENGMSQEKAQEYAIEQVLLTQGDYSGHNAPSIINRLPLGRVLTQFRKFQLIQISLLTRMLYHSFAGTDAAEKALARKQLSWVLGTHALAGGALGLPAANLVGMAVMAAFGDEDEPDNFELMLRREIGNDEMADLILKGLPAAANVDISTKVGMGQTFSVLPFTDIDLSRDGGAVVLASLFGGPAGSQVMRWFDAAGRVEEGDYAQGFAAALPRGFRDAAKAVFLKTEGVRRRNPTRDLAISPDEFTWFDLMLQGIGLPSERITEQQSRSRWLTQTREAVGARSGAIKADYIDAIKRGDPQARVRAEREWRELQRARVRQGLQRQDFSVLRDSVRDQRKREGEARDGVFVRKSERRFIDVLERGY